MSEPSPQPEIFELDDLRLSPTAALFEGGEVFPASMFVTRYESGQGPGLHWHPYPEAFVVQTGTAMFIVGEDEHAVSAGHVVVVPARAPHGFKCASDETLNVVSVHPSPHVVQHDL